MRPRAVPRGPRPTACPARLLSQAVVVVVLALVGGGLLAGPAWATGVLVAPGGPVAADRAAYLVRYDGATEQVYARWHLATPVRRLFWLVPVPGAGRYVPAPRAPFTDVATAAAPVQVSVLTHPGLLFTSSGDVDRQAVQAALAPDAEPVRALAGTTGPATQVLRWARLRGAAVPTATASRLSTYTRPDWSLVGLEMQAAAGGVLRGDVGPVGVSFATRRLTFALPAGGGAVGRRTSLVLAVLAPHEVVLSLPDAGPLPDQRYGGAVDPAGPKGAGALARVARRPMFLTVLSGGVTGGTRAEDPQFVYAAHDRAVRDQVATLVPPPSPMLLDSALGLLAAGVLALLVAVVRRLRRHDPPPVLLT